MMYRISKTGDFERYFGVSNVPAMKDMHLVEFYTRHMTSKAPNDLRKEYEVTVNSAELELMKTALVNYTFMGVK